MKNSAHQRTRAFTIEELLVVVVTIGLFAAVLVPALTRTHRPAKRIQCVSRQKQMGTAFRVFASDNGDLYPLQATTNAYVVPTGATTTQVNSAAAESWQVAQCLWKEVISPQILLCPADWERTKFRRVTDFNGVAGATGGVSKSSLGHPANRNNAVSYAFGVAADESRPQGVLIVDRNVNNVGLAGAGVATNVALTRSRVVLEATAGPTQAVWVMGTRVHDLLQGNLAFADGSVQQATAEVMRQSFENAAKAYGTITNQNLMLFP